MDQQFEDVEGWEHNPDEDPNLNSIIKQLEEGKKPKAHRIKDFKSRVVSLLQIYAQKTQNHDPLFEAYKEVYKQISKQDVVKLDRILNISIGRGANGVSKENLQQAVRQYEGLLCKTSKSKDAQVYTQTLCKLIRLLLQNDTYTEGEIVQMAKDLVTKFIKKRSVKIHLDSFRIITKRFRFLREPIFQVVEAHLNNQQLRPSMKAQLLKLSKYIGKQPNIIKDQAQ